MKSPNLIPKIWKNYIRMYTRKNIKVCKFLITSTNVIAIIRLTSKVTVDVLFSVKYEYHSLGFTCTLNFKEAIIHVK